MYPVANINILTDTFEAWLLRTNAMTYLMSTDVLTGNTNGANTGNSTVSKIAQLWGTFGANTVVVTTGLRGGNISNVQNLPIIVNTDIYVAGAAAPILKVGNSTSISQITSTGAQFSNNAANTVVVGNTIITQSNTTVNSIMNPTGLTVSNGAVNSSLNALGLTVGNVTANQTQLQVGANLIANTSRLLVGNSTVNAAANSTTLGVYAATGSTTANLGGLFTNGILSVTGNASIANTLAVTGNVALANTLTVTGSVNLANTLLVNGAANIQATVSVYVATGAAPTLIVGNATSISSINSTGAAFGNGTANTSVNGSNVTVRLSATENTVITPASIAVSNSTSNVTITQGSVTVGTTVQNSSGQFVGANVSLGLTGLTVGNTTVNSVMTSTQQAVFNASGNTTMNISGFTTTGFANIGGAGTFGGNVGVNGTLSVNGAASVNNNLNVTGNVATNGTVTINNDLVVQVSANADVGANVTAEQLIYRFPKATYSSAKLLIQVKNGTNTQISEVILAQNNTSAFLTVYGTISSPASGNSSPLLATFTANINNANVDLLIIQNQANSAVKVVGQLIK